MVAHILKKYDFPESGAIFKDFISEFRKLVVFDNFLDLISGLWECFGRLFGQNEHQKVSGRTSWT